jgi:hypothetical protein
MNWDKLQSREAGLTEEAAVRASRALPLLLEALAKAVAILGSEQALMSVLHEAKFRQLELPKRSTDFQVRYLISADEQAAGGGE